MNRLHRIVTTKDFIENYPGMTKEEKVFMARVNQRYTSRRDAVKKNSTILAAMVCTPIVLMKMKWRMSRPKDFLVFLAMPLAIYTSGLVVPFLDFSRNSEIFIKEIVKSGLPLSNAFCESLNNRLSF